MGRFLLGLVIGVVVGVLAMTYNPNLPQEVRTGLVEVTALVMRGTERVAEAVGGVANEAADEAGEAARKAQGEATRAPDAPVKEPVPENPPRATQ